jgi:hypothetical protein
MRGLLPIEGSNYSIANINIQTPFYPLFQPLCCSSLDPTTNDGILGLLANIGQPADVLAPTGSLPDKSFEGFFASLPEN